ncbi:MAG TPA: DUF1302 domain-containing protein [Burkholderiaceae bacterium]
MFQARLTPLAAAVLCSLALAPAQAVELPTGNPDAVLRLDNTLRYSLGYRLQQQDPALLANPNYDDGDRNFSKGAPVANRVDVLTELDLVVEKRFGFRVSTAAWADRAYRHLDNTSNASANALVDGVPTAGALSPLTSRYAKGTSGEVLDAFLFANTELGDMPLSLRLGRHTMFWGEGLYGGAALHGVSYGQYALDLWKGYATPGVEAKELFRPRASLSAQLQASSTLTLAAQYFARWESARYPESGSYLTVHDALLGGGQSLIAGPGQRLLQGEPGAPKQAGDIGLSARWSPEWLNGTLGFYARRTADIQPQLAVLPAVASVPAATCGAVGFTPLAATTCYINPAAATVPQILKGQIGQYRAFYGRDVKVMGLSLSTSAAGISLGGELSYRHNMPLASMAVTVLPKALANPAAGQLSLEQLAATDIPGARGNTVHAVANALGVLPKTALFDTASWGVELVFNRWLSVSGNTAAFKGSAAYAAGMNGTLTPYAAGGAANVDAVTKNYVGLGINFTPTWFQVLPSVDLSLPISWGGGLSGISAVMSGGAKNNGNYSFGVAADVNSRYNFALRYVGLYGGYASNAAGAMVVPESVAAAVSDRGHLMFTFKTTF